MKKILLVAAVAGFAGFLVSSLITVNRFKAEASAELAAREAVWAEQRAALELALERSKLRSPSNRPLKVSPVVQTTPSQPQTGPAELVKKLRELKVSANSIRGTRTALYLLEELIAAGPAAIPAIRELLGRNEDFDFGLVAANQPRANRNAVPNDFLLPPSLRFGLFDALKQIGGSASEKLLSEVMGNTGRGVELFWLARTLQEMAPDKYRNAALASARELLLRPSVENPASALDKNDRDNLFSVLTLYGDVSYVANAQTQLLREDGQLDRSTLKYLQQSLGPQAVGIAAQLYDDPRLATSESKEPLARLALNFVGWDSQANEFYLKAINDMNLTKDHRRNLIEDLNQDGFSDTRNLSSRDLNLVENRITLIEQLAPSAADKINAEAFKEAYKDLLNMRERALARARPAQ